ncbi:hypothetical protein Hamer_G001139 [Homarus americanus]|uniref:Transmembrane protein n=1 Tax=Homarus americanus TaxID=6706 RepID=A0A8J5N300_HOMAM|nr:hypothetical protein Hamer_G001139 [Homarus americanus]
MTGSVVTDGGGDVIKGYTIKAAGGRRRVSLNWTFLHSTCTRWLSFGGLFYFLWWLLWPILGMVAMDSTKTMAKDMMTMVVVDMAVVVTTPMELMAKVDVAVVVIMTTAAMVIRTMEDKVMLMGVTVKVTEDTVSMDVIDMVVRKTPRNL